MFCGNCGVENSDGAKFCKGCGKPLGGSTEEKKKINPSVNNVNIADAGAFQASEKGIPQMAGKVKALPQKAVIGATVVIVALIVIAFALISAGKTIKLDDYLTVETEGYDGYGTVRVTVDWDAIEKKYGAKMAFSGSARNQYGSFLNVMKPIEVVQDCVRVEIDQNSELSNGDVITYTWDIDDELSKYVDCKIKYKDGNFTVSGLTKAGTFDAFADMTVEFSGTAPNGNANLNYIGSKLNYYDFKCDKTSGLSNGDTIKVSIDENRLPYYVENLGEVPAELEKEFTVEGLESYLGKIAEISEEGLASMQQQASDVYHATVAQNWGEGEALETFTYIGDYLLTVKNKDSWGTNNKLFLVYKAQVRNSYSNDEKSYNKLNDIYWYIEYQNVMVEADGTVKADVTYYNTPNNRFTIDSGVNREWWGTKSWDYYGYDTLDALYKDVVTANMDLYNHEDNVDESAAPETAEADTEESSAMSGDYILANSGTKLLTMEDLEGLSAEECKIARNEIYARHGRKFDDEGLRVYFESRDWYHGTIDAGDFKESDLSETEIANRDLIVQYEEEKGYR